MMAGLGHLGLPPSTFWAMTLPELDAALRGHYGIGLATSLMTRSALSALMRSHPD
jgi:uncharacterized phage protein (TIGR02216 family)